MLVAIISTVFMYYQVDLIREKVAAQQNALAQAPDRLDHFTRIRQELAGREHDLKRITGHVPVRNDISTVLSTIEQTATALGVEVDIPKIKEENIQSPLLKSLPPFKPVELDVIARGEPDELLTFLHKIEYLPYLSEVLSWNMQANNRRPANEKEASLEPSMVISASVIIWIK